eukprot:3411571-Amphidinium_carterae.2
MSAPTSKISRTLWVAAMPHAFQETYDSLIAQAVEVSPKRPCDRYPRYVAACSLSQSSSAACAPFRHPNQCGIVSLILSHSMFSAIEEAT